MINPNCGSAWAGQFDGQTMGILIVDCQNIIFFLVKACDTFDFSSGGSQICGQLSILPSGYLT